MAAAAGCDPAVIMEAAGIASLGSATGSTGAAALAAAPVAAGAAVAVAPEEAWRAMAGLEEQLARCSDAGEKPEVRQAAGVLRQMLLTVVHGNNPALLQFTQAAVPDLSTIWAYEPTREHLRGLLAADAAGSGGEANAGSSSAAAGGATASSSDP
uniref:Uncharacterized protein n=1 Tax=Pyrodinium bahamense TaxID=73915 RepID=A0A7S0ATH5_9DINO